MTAPISPELAAAQACWFRHKDRGVVGQPLPFLAEVIAPGLAEVERLRAELAAIRDSTYRNATTLRGMADRALTGASNG